MKLGSVIKSRGIYFRNASLIYKWLERNSKREFLGLSPKYILYFCLLSRMQPSIEKSVHDIFKR
jgi:hypothetical protein